MAWLAGVDEDRVFLSVVTFAELRDGIARLPHGPRRTRLADWLRDQLPTRFETRILDIDRTVAVEWGDVVAERRRLARPIGAMDAFIAATARVHDLVLVTRNVRDFQASLDNIFNPWDEPSGFAGGRSSV